MEFNIDWVFFQVLVGIRVILLEEWVLGYWVVIWGIFGYLLKFLEEDSFLIFCEICYWYVQGQVFDGIKQSVVLFSGVMVFIDQYIVIIDGEGNFILEIFNRLVKFGQLVFYQKVGYQFDIIIFDFFLECIFSV